MRVRLKDKMENTNKMVDGMNNERNKKIRENDTKIEQANVTIADAEACAEMVKKDEHDKVTERKQHENEINAIKLNHNQALTQLKNKSNNILMLKKGSGKNEVMNEARSEERKYEVWKHRKKEGRVMSNAQKADKELGKWLEEEMKSEKKEEECERKFKTNGSRLTLN